MELVYKYTKCIEMQRQRNVFESADTALSQKRIHLGSPMANSALSSSWNSFVGLSDTPAVCRLLFGQALGGAVGKYEASEAFKAN